MSERTSAADAKARESGQEQPETVGLNPFELSDEYVSVDRVRMLLKMIPSALVGSYITAGVTAWALWSSAPHRQIIAWLMFLGLVHLIRIRVWVVGRNSAQVERNADRWLTGLRLGVLVTGLAWAALPIFLYPDNGYDQLWLALIVAAICGAAVSELAADALSVALFVLPPLIPLALRLLQSSQPSAQVIGGLTLLFTAFLVKGARKTEKTFREISFLRAKAANLVNFDEATDLPNRIGLNLLLPQALARARRHDCQMALGYIDIDDFKPINDLYGHAVGDVVLIEFANRVRRQLRASETVARLGGDEFVLMIENIDPAHAHKQLSAAFDRIHLAVETPFIVAEDTSIEVECTMGVARYPVDADSAEALLRQADAAMYQAKRRKGERQVWWQLGVDAVMTDEPEPPLDPYGPETARRLAQAEPMLSRINSGFIAAFYAALDSDPEAKTILKGLDPSGVTALKSRQEEHLRQITSAGTDRDTLREHARRLGTVHALTAVSVSMLTRATVLYRELLDTHINAERLLPYRRYRLLRAIESRLQEDLQTQFTAMDGVQQQYMTALSRPRPAYNMLWTDASQSEMDTLTALPGVVAAILTRLNSDGDLLIERSVGLPPGEVSDRLHERQWRPVLDASSPRGRTATSIAWRTQTIQRIDSWLMDDRVTTWQPFVEQFGARCNVAIPFSRSGHVEGVITVYGAYPNQFSSPWMQQWSAGIQRRWESMWAQCSTTHPGPLVSEELAQAYRERLFSGGLEMHMQPIVDLQSGRVYKVEALARLRMPDGELIPPALFMSQVGDRELTHMFRTGLDLALQCIRTWDAQGLDLKIALNLPPSTLFDPGCAEWVERALRRHDVPGHRLTLELLETQQIDDNLLSDAIGRLRLLGVRLAMDDLGSGYSSIDRLSRLTFDVIKIDQKLLRKVMENPLQTVTLVGTLIRLGRDLGCDVVVEGLENNRLLEAARILGAQFGQGYGIAQPMSAQQIPVWVRQFALPVRHGEPDIETYIGALAYLWRHIQSGDGADHLEAQCPIGRFLRDRGFAHSEAASWHAMVHAGGPDARQAGQQLTDWLVRKIQEEGRASQAADPNLPAPAAQV